jgi:hypothetical protein
MVQAILEGKKIQTRRIIKSPCEVHQFGNEIYVTRPRNFPDEYCRFHPYDCPYGEVSDTLWVRETWCRGIARNGDNKIIYKADIETDLQAMHSWKPSIHMPRSVARLFLKVKNIRVERLQDISEEDAMAEGIRGWTKDGSLYKYCVGEVGDNNNVWQDMPRTAKEAFEKLWDSYYQFPKTWIANPWVWIIEFEKQ